LFSLENLVNLAIWKRSYNLWQFSSSTMHFWRRIPFLIFKVKILQEFTTKNITDSEHLIMNSVNVLWLGWGRDDGWMDGWMNGLDMQLWVYDLLDLWSIRITVIVIKRKNRRWGVIRCAKWTLRGLETAIVPSYTDYGSFRNRVVFIWASHFPECSPNPFCRGISWNVSYFNICCLCEVALLKGQRAIPPRAGCYNWSSL
jgi:hypothetical protein